MSDRQTSPDAIGSQEPFVHRHIGPRPSEQREMLATLGLETLDQLIEQVVPASIRIDRSLPLPPGLSEPEALAALRDLAERNQVMRSLIGMGYYNTFLPTVIQRNVLESPAWYTAYTPYQAEISQGRLEALLNFQTMVADLTGLDLANASLLDEATAAAEAMALCRRVSRSKAAAFFVAIDCHPQTIAVLRTRAEPLGIEIRVGDPDHDLVANQVFGALLQYPGSHGQIRDLAPTVASLHESQALAVVATDLLALTLLKPPGELGADVAIGSAQRFGVPLGYGGPHAAFFATRDEHKRGIPGRIIGVSVDSRGKPAYRMALQTREQHIRREKATSNICTAQALLAIIASCYAVYHGPDGLRRIASRVNQLTALLAQGLRQQGISVTTDAFFDTLKLHTGPQSTEVHQRARARGFNLREIDSEHVGVSLDETVTPAEVLALIQIIAGNAAEVTELTALQAATPGSIPAKLRRETAILTHPVFHAHRSETAMLRYLRRLSDRDLALDRCMIPLGSCTMKLNATTEMIPITWAGFGAIHPFAPLEQTQGYTALFEDLERMLCACTGYDAVSLQPNSGAQGEFAGLLAIRAYHRSRGEGHRKICLIPSSAHGTNPASAQMAGLEVVVVQCDKHGNVDVEDLRAKAERYADRLAAIMVTYPSTHGVFEEAIREVCEIVHEHGGQVYLDGANLNAQVGVCAPGHYGSDVSHLNLHKTFCIPHGGGGPGVGPIGVKSHLAPFLPQRAVWDPVSGDQVGPVAAAPWGSAGILPITWTYIAMMGADGLRQATAVAILNANYLARRLEEHYPILYTGPNGMVAHECIIDLRPIKERTGVTVDDVAKRLVDYGFHAPTMSFPVAGTLMIEPTESESKDELDRFVEAMIAIRREIGEIESGALEVQDNPLRNAPHTQADILVDKWSHPYTRERAAFPVPGLWEAKFWSPVNRIDNVYGDRHLVCTCPPMESYQS